MEKSSSSKLTARFVWLIEPQHDVIREFYACRRFVCAKEDFEHIRLGIIDEAD